MGTPREEIAKNIRFYRKKAGMTQKELADAVGAKKSSLSNWELAQNSPDIDTLVKICEVLNVQPKDMFGIYAGAGDEYSPHERDLISAYRARPELRGAVDKLLDVDPETAEETDGKKRTAGEGDPLEAIRTIRAAAGLKAKP